MQVRASGETAASPAVVYALLKDSTTWPSWSPLGSCEMVRGGDDGDPHGVGARRIFRTGPVTVLEEVPELIPEKRVSYLLLAGLPMRDYRADIDLEPSASGGTKIVWRSSFSPKIPGTGWFFRWWMTRVLRQMVDGLTAPARTPPRLR
jgi:hypothetical protein